MTHGKSQTTAQSGSPAAAGGTAPADGALGRGDPAGRPNWNVIWLRGLPSSGRAGRRRPCREIPVTPGGTPGRRHPHCRPGKGGHSHHGGGAGLFPAGAGGDPGFGETSAERILDAADRMLEAAGSRCGCIWARTTPLPCGAAHRLPGSAGASHGGAGCKTGRGTPQPRQGAGTGIPAYQRIFPVAVCLPSPAGTGRGGSGGHPGSAGE